MFEMAEHRVSMLSSSLRRYEDPARSADPRIRQVVSGLATLQAAPAPRAHFRAELRAQLVAVAPRLVAEGPKIEAQHADRPPASATAATVQLAGARLRAAFDRIGQISIARPLGVITAVVAVCAVLLGAAVWMSKKALPGDALYSLKRANENVQLSLAGSDTAKGRKYLEFADNRADEVSALLARSMASADGAGPNAAGGVNAHTTHLVETTLDSMDSDVRNGSQLLGDEAVRDGSAQSLAVMTGWAPHQITQLQSIAAQVGTGVLHDRVASSMHLTTKAFTRARALDGIVRCGCLGDMPADELGPVPCSLCSTPQAPARPTTKPAKKPAKKSATTHTPASSHHTSNPAPSIITSGPVTGSRGSHTRSTPGGGGLGGILPSLPIELPSLPRMLPAPPGGVNRTCMPMSVMGLCLPL
jgi:hypothetical protein